MISVFVFLRPLRLYNKESYVQEVFQNILRSSSNLLSPDSRGAWLDLSRAQRLKVASSLMKCLEEHAFIVADVIKTPETIVEATRRAGMLNLYILVLSLWHGMLIILKNWVILCRVNTFVFSEAVLYSWQCHK